MTRTINKIEILVTAVLGSACGRIGFGASDDARRDASSDGFLSAGLVAYWKLDETGGAVATDSIGTTTGSLVGAPIWMPAAGKIGGALSFGPSGDRVNLGTPAAITNLPALTISVWVKPNSVLHDTTNHCVFDKGDSGAGGWAFDTASITNGDIAFLGYITTGDVVQRSSVGNVLGVGQWAHIVATWDASDLATGIHLYVDGTETAYGAAVDATGARPDDSTIPAAIDCITFTGFDGSIDDVKIFNRVLGPSEVVQL